MPFYMPLKTLLQRILPWITGLGFGVLIAWQIWPIFSDASRQLDAASTAQISSDDSQLQQILAAEIFGVVNDSAQPEPANTNSLAAPQLTSLPYVLKGVLSAVKPTEGSAIIEISPGDSRFFRAGRPISGAIKLVEVHSDHIVIDNQGRPEILRLAELSLSMASASANPIRDFSDVNSSTSPSPSPSGNPNADAPNSSNDNSPSGNTPNDNTMDREDMINRDRIRQRLEELRARNPS
jgi:type II secretory pathway component PulC